MSVAVAGVGMHPFGRFPDASLKDMARVAVVNALVDAGVEVGEIEAVFSSNSMAGLLQGQEMIRGQSTLRDVGLEGVPIVNVENACAGGSTAIRQAVLAIRAGACRTALAVGFEKMFVEDRDASLTALETAADVEIVGGLGLQFTAVYAMRLRRKLESGELTERDLVDVTVKSHHNGFLNPMAQHQIEVTPEQVEGARKIAEPLTLLMCSSICDGAAAAVLVADGESSDGRPRIRIRAAAAASGQAPEGGTGLDTIAARAGRLAYEEASVGPADIDVSEVHDAMAPGELLYCEQLGLCEPGGAGQMLASGESTLSGSHPVNPSGGLASRGHPVGATGIAQVAELTWQLRGEAGDRQIQNQPRLALAHNSGGWVEGDSAACNVTILERSEPWD
jgi:acetyl-CoA acetyltransferase